MIMSSTVQLKKLSNAIPSDVNRLAPSRIPAQSRILLDTDVGEDSHRRRFIPAFSRTATLRTAFGLSPTIRSVGTGNQ